MRPSDVIFTCTICQKPLSSAYSSGDENDELRKKDLGHPSLNGKVTKFWLTECAHLTCATHFDGGGVPFHSDESRSPRAPCPFCSSERDDHTDKALYFVHGIKKGEYDSEIPATYFETLPAQLDGDDPSSEALRFQFLSLVRFGLKVGEKLQTTAGRLENWEGKKSEIVRSLNHIAPLRDALVSAAYKLQSLGQDISPIQATLNLVGAGLDSVVVQQRSTSEASKQQTRNASSQDADISHRHQIGSRSRLASASVADLRLLSKDEKMPRGQLAPSSLVPDGEHGSAVAPSAKRKRTESKGDETTQLQEFYDCRPKHRESSNDLMPPPPRPLTQQPIGLMIDEHINRDHRDALRNDDFHGRIHQGNTRRTDILQEKNSRYEGLEGKGLQQPIRTNVDTVRSANTNPTGIPDPAQDFDLWPGNIRVERSPYRGSYRQYAAFLQEQPSFQFRSRHDDSTSSPMRNIVNSRNFDPSSDGELLPHQPHTPSTSTLRPQRFGAGLSSNVRSSNRRTMANSSVHRQQMGISQRTALAPLASPHFRSRQSLKTATADGAYPPCTPYGMNPIAAPDQRFCALPFRTIQARHKQNNGCGDDLRCSTQAHNSRTLATMFNPYGVGHRRPANR